MDELQTSARQVWSAPRFLEMKRAEFAFRSVLVLVVALSVLNVVNGDERTHRVRGSGWLLRCGSSFAFGVCFLSLFVHSWLSLQLLKCELRGELTFEVHFGAWCLLVCVGLVSVLLLLLLSLLTCPYLTPDGSTRQERQ